MKSKYHPYAFPLLTLTLITWLEIVLVRFVHCKVTFPPFFCILYFLESPYGKCTLKEWGVMFRLLNSGEFLKFFGKGDLPLPPLINLFNHLYISVLTQAWLFYTPVLLYLFCCSNCSSFGHWELIFQLVPTFLWHSPIIVSFFVVVLTIIFLKAPFYFLAL